MVDNEYKAGELLTKAIKARENIDDNIPFVGKLLDKYNISDYLENTDNIFDYTQGVDTATETIKQMINEVDGSIKTSNATALGLAESYSEAFDVKDGVIEFKGNVYEVHEAILGLQADLDNLGIEDKNLFNQLSKYSSETSKTIEQVGDSDKTISQNIMYSNQQIEDGYYDLIKVYNEYIKAQQSGDADKVKELDDNLDNVLTQDESKKILVNRFANPEDICNLVLFLASDKSSYINSEIIKIDGGSYE